MDKWNQKFDMICDRCDMVVATSSEFHLERRQERKANRANQSIVQRTSDPFNPLKFLWKRIIQEIAGTEEKYQKVLSSTEYIQYTFWYFGAGGGSNV